MGQSGINRVGDNVNAKTNAKLKSPIQPNKSAGCDGCDSDRLMRGELFPREQAWPPIKLLHLIKSTFISDDDLFTSPSRRRSVMIPAIICNNRQVSANYRFFSNGL